MRIDGIAMHFDWEHPSRVRKTIVETGLKKILYEQSWWFTFRFGVRRSRRTKEQKLMGYNADYFNPFVYIRLFGFCVGLAFSISWGIDSPKSLEQEQTINENQR